MAAAIEWLEKAIAQLMEQVPPTLYGNCYVISRERDRGVVWQPKSKQTAAIELSHHSKVDTKLFQKVKTPRGAWCDVRPDIQCLFNRNHVYILNQCFFKAFHGSLHSIDTSKSPRETS